MEKPVNQRDEFESGYWRRWLSIGFEFAAVIVFFMYMGYLADVKLGTEPWLMLAGFFMGFIGMFYLIFKEVWKFKDKM
ncbi:MAG: hypothetical protein A2Y07_09390 [Planctomycetes bacterium GWF2_50_10]|nr:MAG: hypothetical protein A2Y07_09390 [Planctomycetes bacterium GWF2_50_10]